MKEFDPITFDQLIAGLSLDEKTVLQGILEELARAKEKHPSWPKDIIHAGAIVGEESGELVRSCLQFVYEGAPLSDAMNEATETAAMGIRFLSAGICLAYSSGDGPPWYNGDKS